MRADGQHHLRSDPVQIQLAEMSLLDIKWRAKTIRPQHFCVNCRDLLIQSYQQAPIKMLFKWCIFDSFPLLRVILDLGIQRLSLFNFFSHIYPLLQQTSLILWITWSEVLNKYSDSDIKRFLYPMSLFISWCTQCDAVHNINSFLLLKSIIIVLQQQQQQNICLNYCMSYGAKSFSVMWFVLGPTTLLVVYGNFLHGD